MKQLPLIFILLFLFIACESSTNQTNLTTEAPAIQVAETITLSISGMDCDGCVKSVTEAIKGVEGVAEVEVSLDNHTAIVKGTNVDLFLLTAAIDSAGYGATPVDPSMVPSHSDSTKTDDHSH